MFVVTGGARFIGSTVIQQILLGVRGDDSNGLLLLEVLKKEGIRNYLIPVKPTQQRQKHGYSVKTNSF